RRATPPPLRRATPCGARGTQGRMRARRSPGRMPRPDSPSAEQISLPMPGPKHKSRGADRTPEEAPKVAIARRAQLSAVPGHVKLTFTLDIPRELAERLSARAIR